MLMDQKRHLEAVGTSDILGRILICEVNNKVWTQGHSKAALWLSILQMSNMEKRCTFGKWDFSPPQKMCSIIPTKSYRCYREDSHPCRINTCTV